MVKKNENDKILQRPLWLFSGFIFGWGPVLFAGPVLDYPGLNFLFGIIASIIAFTPRKR